MVFFFNSTVLLAVGFLMLAAEARLLVVSFGVCFTWLQACFLQMGLLCTLRPSRLQLLCEFI